MEKKLQHIISSGLLDNYIIGVTSPAESSEIESYISEYPEFEAEYIRLQEQLEILAHVHAHDAPEFILDNVLASLNAPKEQAKKVIPLNPQAYAQHRRTPWLSIAASISALIFASIAFSMYQKNMSLIQENQVVVDEIFDLRSDIDKNNSKLDDMMLQFMKLNNPETEKYVLRGNAKAKDLKTVAYINPVDKTSMIDVVSLPKLSEDQTYQIWAELQGKMVNLGILDESDRKLKSIPYMEDALALSITIESRNGKKENEENTENEVAEISLRTKKL